MGLSQFPPAAGGVPTGATADRPASPSIGDVFYNGNDGILEIYNGTNWVPCSAPAGTPIVSASDVGTSRPYTSAAIAVVFTPQAVGGAALGFTAVATSASTATIFQTTETSTSFNVPVGLPGTYTYYGNAYNGFGTSPNTPTATVAVTTVPQAPTIGSASTSSVTTDVTLTWTIGNNGGKNLTSHTITPYIGATAQTAITGVSSTATSYTVTGLTSASAYTFKVKAINANGTSEESSASNSVTIPTFAYVDYLVVAGGGGSGTTGGDSRGFAKGGGGGGGFRSGTIEALVSGNLTVTVGAGGGGGAQGSNSVFSSITSTGGGYGGNQAGGGGSTGGDGGDGGSGGEFTTASAVAGQGYKGGGGNSSQNTAGGGGGGAGGTGQGGGSVPNGAGPQRGGYGGPAATSGITGSTVYYAGGGGGGSGYNTTNTGSSGGLGGNTSTTAFKGGAANGVTSGNGGSGTANTGGGAGGSCGQSTNVGSSGGSGIVILKYLDTLSISGGAGLTFTTSTSVSGYKVTSFTAGTGTVSLA